MADVKLSALPAAAAAADADKLVSLQSGVVVNQTASALKTYMHAAPGAIGGTTPAAGTFTVLTASTSAALTSPTFAAGSATAGSWPIHTPGTTLLTAAVAGAVEVDATNFYLTTEAGNRGIVPVTQYIRQHADSAVKANDGSQHAIFDSVTNGTLTLAAGTYTCEALISFKAMSATSGNMKWSLLGAGTATLANVLQLVMGIDAAVNTTTAGGGVHLITEASTVNVAPASTSVVCTVGVQGTFEVSVGGTIIPSIAQSTAVATAVVTAGTYFRCTRIGAAATVSVGAWT